MGLPLLFVGLVLLGIGWLYYYSAKLYEGWASAEGEVVAFKNKSGMYSAVAKLRLPDGSIKYAIWPVSTNKQNGNLGTKLTFYVNRRDQKQIVAGLFANTKFGYLLGGLGLFLVIASVNFIRFDTFSTFIGVVILTQLLVMASRIKKKISDQPNRGNLHPSRWSQIMNLKTYDTLEEATEVAQALGQAGAEIKAQEKATQRIHPAVTRVLLLFVAIPMAVASYFWFSARKEFLSTAKRTPGVVVDLVYKSGNKGSGSYRPVFEFTPENTSTPIRVQSYYGTNPPRYDRGDRVTLLYDPNNPTSVLEDDGPYMNYFGPALVGLVSLAFFAGAIMSRSQEPEIQHPEGFRRTG